MPDETPVGLTTLERLRIHVQRNVADDTQDDKLTMYGEMMSERVTNYARREFLPDPAGDDDEPVERIFAYDGSGTLDFGLSELRELDAITLYTDRDDALQITLQPGQYALSPRGRARGGTYLSLDLALPTLVPLYYGFEWQVTVSGFWGMAVVPKDVELAVLVATYEVLKNPGSWAVQQLGDYTVTVDNQASSTDDSARGGLPRAALWALAPWKRHQRVSSLRFRRPEPSARAAYPVSFRDPFWP